MARKNDSAGTVTLEEYRQGLRPEGYSDSDIHNIGSTSEQDPNVALGETDWARPLRRSRTAARPGFHVVTEDDISKGELISA